MSWSKYELRVRLVPFNMCRPPSEFLVTVQRRVGASFMDPFCSYVSRLSCRSLQPCDHLMERADHLTLFCVMFPCVLSLSHMVSPARCATWFIDSWSLPSSLLVTHSRLLHRPRTCVYYFDSGLCSSQNAYKPSVPGRFSWKVKLLSDPVKREKYDRFGVFVYLFPDPGYHNVLFGVSTYFS